MCNTVPGGVRSALRAHAADLRGPQHCCARLPVPTCTWNSQTARPHGHSSRSMPCSTSAHGCTVPATVQSRARGSLASRHAARAARGAVDARQLLEISSDTGNGVGSANDTSTRPAGTQAVVSAQHEAMRMLMSVRRMGGPTHISERGSSRLNAWAASEGASSMLKSSSPGHLPPSMESCAGEVCRLPEKRAFVRSEGGAAR